jgi:hypothetical protein
VISEPEALRRLLWFDSDPRFSTSQSPLIVPASPAASASAGLRWFLSHTLISCCHSGYLSWNRPDSSWQNLRPCSTTFTSTPLTSCAYAHLMYITSCIYFVGQSTQFSYAVVDALSTADTTQRFSRSIMRALMEIGISLCRLPPSSVLAFSAAEPPV